MLLSNQSIEIKKSVDDVWPVAGKRVLIRVDFNVPTSSGDIDDDFRIRSAIPTIRRIVDQGGICILISHLGRPTGVDYDAATAEQDKRRAPILVPNTKGKTAFFSGLNGDAKATILAWSSQHEKAASLSTAYGSGKTAIFARLPEDEKRRLLLRFMNERKEELFPQLGFAAGYEKELSLQPVAVKLAELLDQHVYFGHDCLGAKSDIAKLRCGEVMLLENLRFYTNENSPDEQKRMQMAGILASYADVYINDAFGTAHRDSASMTGIPKVLQQGAAGYLMEKEISYFSKVLNNPPRPLLAIIGGAKLSDKTQVLENLLDCVDSLFIGGALAYTFLKAQGHSIGSSHFEDSCMCFAKRFLLLAAERQVKVTLTEDHVCHAHLRPADAPLTTTSAEIPDGYAALDIGPQTIQTVSHLVKQCRSVIWNGPLGMFEMPFYAFGTFSVARVVSQCSAAKGTISIVGGGDTASAMMKSGEAAHISHISTGGNASLELLEGKVMPAVVVLDNKE
ncbi:putative mitochondrial 3-phosphoglycerate kinase, glycosomal [Leptomonas pyrrhocoris]|uniref:Phosphoglycerate kinase n=1 Tax=Leptomonas pyrrhocoris TaxID=157538 RepID=A0A0M9FT55_LEPPY|nr:putative mitochondrial 3-phosphoglycerate kinase, glycosomal [Leptomonas pyrrhocoris]KPA75419.1 putative mitochondrial 3-phosphoglycerate kinase, glycosomal [Leptomonas pyrrhocoris]|eukprot:XP_015653858.1 putative mitochondrial 3-phosphoglycerate kinase, glycosomal [Leptomonas pyrrhocoris]